MLPLLSGSNARASAAMLLLASLGLPLAGAAPTCDFNLFPGTSCTNKAFQQDSPPH